jgi:hypothetical protein
MKEERVIYRIEHLLPCIFAAWSTLIKFDKVSQPGQFIIIIIIIIIIVHNIFKKRKARTLYFLDFAQIYTVDLMMWIKLHAYVWVIYNNVYCS